MISNLIDYVIVEMISKDDFDKGDNIEVLRGWFGGLLAMKTNDENNGTVLFVILYTGENEINILSTEAYTIMHFVVGRGETREHVFLRKSDADQEAAANELAGLLLSLDEQGLSTGLNPDLILTSSYNKNRVPDLYELTPGTAISGAAPVNSRPDFQTTSPTVGSRLTQDTSIANRNKPYVQPRYNTYSSACEVVFHGRSEDTLPATKTLAALKSDVIKGKHDSRKLLKLQAASDADEQSNLGNQVYGATKSTQNELSNSVGGSREDSWRRNYYT